MIKKYLPPIFWMALIFILSSIPGTAFPEQPFSGFTELVHVAVYFILGLLWYRALKEKVALILTIGILYAISDEIHQIFVPFRQFDILDMLMDAVGVIAGVLVGKIFYAKMKKANN